MKATDDFVQFKMTLPKEANDITDWKVIVSQQTYKIRFNPKNTLRNSNDDEYTHFKLMGNQHPQLLTNLQNR